MSRLALLMIGFLALVCTAGAFHGVMTDRWRPSSALRESLNRLDNLPKSFGDWSGTDSDIDPEALTRTGIRGYIYRTYRNARNGSAISALIVCGQGGPISVHTPDVCYAGNGYQAASAQRHVPIDSADFWAIEFAKPNAIVPERLQIYWSWSVDANTWISPENPRLALARFPAVYKLYLVRDLAGKSENNDKQMKDFLAAFLPELRQALAQTNP